jgi:hypothetical protein
MLGQSGGSYKATRRNRQLLRRYRAGKSIGFTAKASLKAKGLLPRSDGRFVLGPKYSGTGKPRCLRSSRQRPAIRKKLTRRRLPIKGGGDYNNDYEVDEYGEPKNVTDIVSCEFEQNAQMRSDITKLNKLFRNYYKEFFKVVDANLDKEIAETEADLEKLKRVNANKIDKEEREKLEREREDLEYNLHNLRFIREDLSLENLLKTLMKQSESPIGSDNSRLDKIMQFAEYDRLPRLPEDVRVWRSLKNFETNAGQEITVVRRSNGNVSVKKVKNISGETISHSTSYNGVASTSYNFRDSIIFAEDSSYGIGICLEFTIPKGTLAIPINAEVSEALFEHDKKEAEKKGRKLHISKEEFIRTNDEHEIIILESFELRLDSMKCVSGGFYRERPVAVYNCTFELTD